MALALIAPTAASADDPLPIPLPSASEGPSEKATHCTGNAHRTDKRPGPDNPAPPAHIRCFETFSEAVASGTRGNVQLPKLFDPRDFSDSAAAAYSIASLDDAVSAPVVIGINYYDDWYNGGTMTWVVDAQGPLGCTANQTWVYANFSGSAVINDAISSARAFGGCTTFLHFEDANFEGDRINCLDCPFMFYMNDRASSALWTQTGRVTASVPYLQDPTFGGFHRFYQEAYSYSSGNDYVGAYVAVVRGLLDYIGVRSYTDLAQDQQNAVDQLASAYVVDPALFIAQPYVDYTIWHAETLGLLAMVDANYGPPLNSEEKKVCGRHMPSCWKSRNTPDEAVRFAEEYYPGLDGHNDRKDAFRHCAWVSLMVRRSGGDFAKKFSDAHEYGDKNQPLRERDMDLHNNYWGLDTGRNYGTSDRRVANRCSDLVKNRSLKWLK